MPCYTATTWSPVAKTKPSRFGTNTTKSKIPKSSPNTVTRYLSKQINQLLLRNNTLVTAGGVEGFYLWSLPECQASPFDASERTLVAKYDYNQQKQKNVMLVGRKSQDELMVIEDPIEEAETRPAIQSTFDPIALELVSLLETNTFEKPEKRKKMFKQPDLNQVEKI